MKLFNLRPSSFWVTKFLHRSLHVLIWPNQSLQQLRHLKEMPSLFVFINLSERLRRVCQRPLIGPLRVRTISKYVTTIIIIHIK